MTTNRIRVDFLNEEGAVIRLLGLIERRGFRVTRIAMGEAPDGEAASITLDLAARDASRSLDVLGPQIRRLHGVRTVTFFSAPQASAA